jgi:Ribbon-helix-helix protein, copG family
MRTTLTIDDDVAAGLEQLRKSQNVSLKGLINEALRRGLREMTERSKPRKPFRTRTVNLGPPKIPLDNIAEALAIAEGEWYR